VHRIEQRSEFSKLDFFNKISLLSKNTVGREIAWDYLRINYDSIIEQFGLDDPRVGQALVDISASFENEFLFYELLEWVFNIVDGATANARFKALEIASTNIVWLFDKEQEIIDAFPLTAGRGNKEGENKEQTNTSPRMNPLLDFTLPEKTVFVKNARAAFRKHLSETNLEIFSDLKKKLL
jgi:hypothetical protein